MVVRSPAFLSHVCTKEVVAEVLHAGSAALRMIMRLLNELSWARRRMIMTTTKRTAAAQRNQDRPQATT